jgi:UDP-sulfoquinovose synthase
MRVLILGGDGYLGWPTALHFSARGDEVAVVDNFAKRQWEFEQGIEPLLPIAPLHRRVQLWREQTGKDIKVVVCDLLNHHLLYRTLAEFKPDTIVHYAEQPSAPYSMQSRNNAIYTQQNNIVGTLNLLFAMESHSPDAHLIKLGTMGEYGTPNVDIEEGWLTLTHNGRTDTVLFPKRPGSIYHLSKVHDSGNIEFACRIWKMRATDLNQGVVYGHETEHAPLDSELRTSFHYDDVFGTVLNRFLVQAAVGKPLTVYGKGGQTRGFLNIRDTIQCVALAADHPAAAGEFRVFNQFTEQFSVNVLAEKVEKAAKRAGVEVKVDHLVNPRLEAEEHYYNAKNTRLVDLGLKPHLLDDATMDFMFAAACKWKERVDHSVMLPRVKWRSGGELPK